MKNISLILLSFCLFYCKKKETVEPTPNTNSKQAPITSTCKDSTYNVKSQPNQPVVNYTVSENCSTIVVKLHVTNKSFTVPVPQLSATVTNYSSITIYNADTNTDKYYYNFYRSSKGYIVYSIGDSKSATVGGVSYLNKTY